MNYDCWERLADLTNAGSGCVDLPGLIRARVREWVLQIGPAAHVGAG
jgi:hypothetical protein